MASRLSNPSKRMTAQPSRPVRYRPGKAHQEDSSDEEESEDEQATAPPPKKTSVARQQPQRPAPRKTTQEDSDEDGFVTDEEDDADGGVTLPPQAKDVDADVVPTPAQLPESEDEDEESESGSEEDSESASDASSESEAPTRKFQRPTFIKKSERTTTSTAASTNAPTPAPLTSATPAPLEETRARRLAETDFQISEKLNRDNLARAAGRRAWDDDDAVDPTALVDDTDGLDPAAEHSAWRLRELQRLKRDREMLVAKEREIEEIERRRNLSAAERAEEDKVYIDKQREEKEGRAQSGYLARYHHKGAFFQDDERAKELSQRDVMGARFEDDVDKSALPEYMRIRDMNKLGKKGRTRYKDLRGEDTGGFGNDVKRWKGAMGAATGAGDGGGGDRMDYRGVDERFLPDDDRRSGGPMSSGANNAPLGPRKERRQQERSRSRSPRRDDRDTYRPPRKRSYSRSRSRSRSRSPTRPRLR